MILMADWNRHMLITLVRKMQMLRQYTNMIDEMKAVDAVVLGRKLRKG